MLYCQLRVTLNYLEINYAANIFIEKLTKYYLNLVKLELWC